MQTYRIPLVPGPVSIPLEVLEAYNNDYASADLEDDFFRLYSECEFGLQQILSTRNDIALMSGEGMLALWGALKSALLPGDRVLAVATGVFGYGIADMARQIGAEVEVVGFGHDEAIDPEPVREMAEEFQPHLITAVHCETPSGILNPLDEVGQIAQEVDALFYVDFVASGGGVPVLVDEWQIDLGLLGSQKALSLMPDLSMVTVSPRAWERIARANYAGYDALLPFRTAWRDRYMPYTHNWHALAGLKVALDGLLAEGLDDVFRRHQDAMLACHTRLEGMGLRLYPRDRRTASPTVTAAYVPDNYPWPLLNEALRAEGVGVGGSYGPLNGVVFRIGHMGSQANLELVHRGMDVLEWVLEQR
jgi:aspartate aminotransferase-like enzyme